MLGKLPKPLDLPKPLNLAIPCVRLTGVQIGEQHSFKKKKHFWAYTSGPGSVAHACNPSTFGGQGGRSLEVRSLRLAWPHSKTLSLLKTQKSAGCGGGRM